MLYIIKLNVYRLKTLYASSAAPLSAIFWASDSYLNIIIIVEIIALRDLLKF